MALPKYLYFVVVEKYGDTLKRAYVEKVYKLENLKSQFTRGRHFENILIIQLADSKAQAEQLKKCWNESYKNLGNLYNFE